jgi:hypothetical protein
VKLAEFSALCEREWGEARGDVVGLLLTDESLSEFETDLLIHPDDQCRSLLNPFDLVNPITRSVVKVTGGASVDSAEVYRYYARPHPAGIPCT